MKEWMKWEIKTKNKKDFPECLKSISDCPEKLFYRGNWSDEIFVKTLAIVGSRKMTKYGQSVIENFMPNIISRNISVISGFMYGVDTEAHRQCLNMGGRTIAVLGSGLNCLNPSENDKLYTEILENNGLIISEYEKDFMATVWSFPKRNRIVSGLSNIGVLVIEADIKSGSLITAKLTLRQGKKLFAIPGQITSKISNGTNWLIKSGSAKMITEINDIFEDNNHAPEQKTLFKDFSDLSKIEKSVIDCIENEEIEIDEICRKTGKSVMEISIVLSSLLMRDLIYEEKNKYYIN